MGDLDGALSAYERALQHNNQSTKAMNAISTVLRTKENFPKAVEYLLAILKLEANNGEVWGSLGKRPGRKRRVPCWPGRSGEDGFGSSG